MAQCGAEPVWASSLDVTGLEALYYLKPPVNAG